MTERSAATVIVLKLPDAECKVTMIKFIDCDLIATLCTAEMHRMFHSTHYEIHDFYVFVYHLKGQI